MSENDIKPVAWVERNEDGHDRMWSSTLESWANRPANPEPLYDQAAIDRLSADAIGYKRIADEVAGMLESAEDLIDRLTAELTLVSGERNRLQLKWDEFRQTKNAEVQRLTEERDWAVSDAERYRWIRLRIGGRESVEDDFKWEYESGECLAQEVDSAIDAARSEGK